MALLKNEPPRLEGMGLKEKVDRVGAYLHDLYESLNFILTHLGGSNMNGASLKIPVLSADGKDALGSMGVVSGGVGLSSGTAALRVSGEGVEVTTDGGRTWSSLDTLYYAGGDTYGETFLVPHAGIITTRSTALWLSVPVDKSLENVSSISVTSLIGGARIASGGYVNGYGDSTEWVGQTGLTFVAEKAGDRLVSVRAVSATAYVDGNGNTVTNNTPITLVGRITLAFR